MRAHRRNLEVIVSVEEEDLLLCIYFCTGLCGQSANNKTRPSESYVCALVMVIWNTVSVLKCKRHTLSRWSRLRTLYLGGFRYGALCEGLARVRRGGAERGLRGKRAELGVQGGRGVGVHEGSGETEGELEHDLSPDWTIWGRDERRLSEKRIYYACSCHLGGKRIVQQQ